MSIAKSDILRMEVETTSPMPAGKDSMTPEEIADLLAYLLTLRQP
jgi:mono/diheme cytochrome c family protein